MKQAIEKITVSDCPGCTTTEDRIVSRRINAAKRDSDGYRPTAWAIENDDGTINVHVITRGGSVSVLNVEVKKRDTARRELSGASSVRSSDLLA